MAVYAADQFFFATEVRSIIQLWACTTPLTAGDIARGAISWATYKKGVSSTIS